MKTLITDYTFNKTAKTVTFTKLTTVELSKILLITNTTSNTIIYNFASAAKGGTVATNVLTLLYDTTAMANTDKLQIYYDDQQTSLPYSQALTASATITPSSGKRLKIEKVQVMQNPDNTSATKVSLNFASIGDFMTGWAFSDKTEWVGAVDEVLSINLTGSQAVSVNIRYKEI